MRWTALALGALLMLASSVAVADQPVTVLVNGRPVQSDVPPQIIGGRTMVPLRFVAEALGATVGWDANTYTVTVTTFPVSRALWTAPITYQQGAGWRLAYVACTIGKIQRSCLLDTGAAYGGELTAAMAAVAEVVAISTSQFTTGNGIVSEGLGPAPVTIGNSAAVMEQIAINPNAPPYPVIGVQALIDACPGHLDFDLTSAAPAISCVTP